MGLGMIYSIRYKSYFFDCILNYRNLRGLRYPRLMILPGLSVTEVFGHFDSSFTKDEILPAIENYEPNTRNANPSGNLTPYSENK
jgi:hypothetical protein